MLKWIVSYDGRTMAGSWVHQTFPTEATSRDEAQAKCLAVLARSMRVGGWFIDWRITSVTLA
jgi:hypothetical protein